MGVDFSPKMGEVDIIIEGGFYGKVTYDCVCKFKKHYNRVLLSEEEVEKVIGFLDTVDFYFIYSKEEEIARICLLYFSKTYSMFLSKLLIVT